MLVGAVTGACWPERTSVAEAGNPTAMITESTWILVVAI